MVDRLQKVADKFEYKLHKKAQSFDSEPSELKSDIEVGYQEDAFQKWMDQNFTQSDKNKIASNIANSVDDFDSLLISLSIKNKALQVSANLNGKESDVAKKIVQNEVASKAASVLSKFPEGSKYVGWIRFPK